MAGRLPMGQKELLRGKVMEMVRPRLASRTKRRSVIPLES
jgi:hypothetical protein